jgi:hypothetical protein
MIVILDTAPCSLVDNECLGGTYYHHVQSFIPEHRGTDFLRNVGI